MAKKSTSVSNQELISTSQNGRSADDGLFQSFIENLPVMFYAVEPTPPHTPIYISPTFAAFGYPLDEWLTNSEIWDHVIHPADRDNVLNGTRLAMQRGENIDFEYRVICSDGRVLWIRDRSCFIKDNDGKLLCWQGIIMDVTDRKEITDALKVSESRYRQLFENANDIIYVHDLKGNYISINQAAQKLFGYTLDEALKLNMTDITAPEHLDLVWEKLSEKTIGTAGQTVYEIDCITKGSERISLEVNSSVIMKDGEPIAVQGIARDITERRQAENRLRNALSLFESTFESTADGIVVMSLDRNAIVTCNKKFVEMWNVDNRIIATKDGHKLVEHVAAQLKNRDDFIQKLDEIYIDPLATVTEVLELKDGRHHRTLLAAPVIGRQSDRPCSLFSRYYRT